jgi:hypothetical protein
MVMDNVWYNKQSAALEKQVIDHFQKAGKWGSVIWNDNEYLHPKTPKELKKEYRDHVYVNVPADIYQNLYGALYTFIDMQSRRSPWTSFIQDQKSHTDYLNIFNKMLNITYRKLVENKISLVIMNRAPHFGGDLLLYLLAKELGIKTLLLEQSQLPNKYFYYFDHYDYGNFATSAQVSDIEVEEIPNSFEKYIFYMEGLKKKPTIKAKLRKRFDDEIKLVKESITFNGWEQSLHRYALRKRHKKNYDALLSSSVSLDVPFVYFALHLQPEKTTSAWGGVYCDQILAIERLSSQLPEGWFIYVKENPKQKFTMRGEWFFDRLKSISNVKLVEEDTYKLLKHCQFAATITGTVGWEAITGGKNVLVFGWGVWYKTLPGVFEFSDSFDINQIINYKIDHKELENSLAKLKSRMLTGVIYTAYRKNYPQYNEQENTALIIDNFETILYKDK